MLTSVLVASAALLLDGSPRGLSDGRRHTLPGAQEAFSAPGRRHVVGLATSAASALACSRPALAATLPSAGDLQYFKAKRLAKKAKALRQAVHAAGARGSAVDQVSPRVLRERGEVLLPLLECITVSTAEWQKEPLGGVGLSEEQQEELRGTTQELKGHYSELDYYLKLAVKKGGPFDEYESKTTGSLYPGGKVERELEEVEETVDKYLELSAIYLKAKVEAGPFAAAGLKAAKRG